MNGLVYQMVGTIAIVIVIASRSENRTICNGISIKTDFTYHKTNFGLLKIQNTAFLTFNYYLGSENAKNLKENGSAISAYGNETSMMSNLTMRQTIDFQDESEALLLQHHLSQQQQRGKRSLSGSKTKGVIH